MLKRIHKELKNLVYRIEVARIERLKAEGKLKEAECIKGGLPGIVSAGVCEGGYSKENVISFSENLMLDIATISSWL